MSQTAHIVLFWIVVIAAIRLAVWFPESLPARILFSRHEPERARGEPEVAFLLRCARFYGGWLAQAAFLFGVGAIALRLNASLAESLAFLVLWTAVLPALGACALIAAAIDLARALRVRRRARARTAEETVHGAKA